MFVRHVTAYESAMIHSATHMHNSVVARSHNTINIQPKCIDELVHTKVRTGPARFARPVAFRACSHVDACGACVHKFDEVIVFCVSVHVHMPNA